MEPLAEKTCVVREWLAYPNLKPTVYPIIRPHHYQRCIRMSTIPRRQWLGNHKDRPWLSIRHNPRRIGYNNGLIFYYWKYLSVNPYQPPIGPQPAVPGQTYIQFPSGIILTPTDPKHPIEQGYLSGGQQIHTAQPGATSIFQPGIIHVYPAYPQMGPAGNSQVLPGYTQNQGGGVLLPPGPPSYPGFYIPSPGSPGSNGYPSGGDRQPNNLVPRGQPEQFTQPPPVTLYPSYPQAGGAATPGPYSGIVPPMPPRYLREYHWFYLLAWAI